MYFYHVCVCLPSMNRCPREPEEGIGSPDDGDAGGGKLSDMGASIQTQVRWQSSK